MIEQQLQVLCLCRGKLERVRPGSGPACVGGTSFRVGPPLNSNRLGTVVYHGQARDCLTARTDLCGPRAGCCRGPSRSQGTVRLYGVRFERPRSFQVCKKAKPHNRDHINAHPSPLNPRLQTPNLQEPTKLQHPQNPKALDHPKLSLLPTPRSPRAPNQKRRSHNNAQCRGRDRKHDYFDGFLSGPPDPNLIIKALTLDVKRTAGGSAAHRVPTAPGSAQARQAGGRALMFSSWAVLVGEGSCWGVVGSP